MALSLGQAARAHSEAQRLASGQVRVENVNVSNAGGRLVVGLELNLDSLRLPASMQFVFTPVVRGRTQTRRMPQIVVNGRRADIAFRRGASKRFEADVTAVRRKNNTPQTVTYSAVLPYEQWMDNSDVVVNEDLCGCGDFIDNHEVPLKKLRKPFMPYLRPAAEARKDRSVQGRAYIEFPVNKTTLYPEYRNNPAELAKIVETIRVVKEDKNTKISGIVIHGFASPESSYDHNAWLAEHRAATLKDHVRKMLDMDNSLFRVGYTAEDWKGLREYVAASSLPHRDEILQVVDDSRLDPDTREWRIKLRWPDDYRVMLDECYPTLRHSDYVVNYTVKAFSVDETREVMKTNPKLLSLEEMFLLAQTYEPGSGEFNQVMETAVRLFPADPTANINAALARMASGDIDAAAECLDKAGNTPRAIHARGVMALLKGDSNMALRLFREALAAGDADAQRNIDILEL